MIINILTAGFETPNARAFLFPLIINKSKLKKAGIKWKMFTKLTPEIYDCDILAIDSKYHKFRWKDDTVGVIKEFEEFKKRIKKVFYFDTTDSTGYIQTEILPIVDKYCKAQLIKDKEKYLEPMYGFRMFADYYHKKYGVVDKNPEFSEPIKDKSLLNKLVVSWNSGIADYSVIGTSLMALYYRIPFRPLLSPPYLYNKACVERKIDVHCRMGVNYPRESIAFQRKKIKEILKEKIPTNKVKRLEFFREMKDSKIIMSPFGLGEITLKDFEAFICGGLLMKADMSFMETFPNFYQDNKTIVSYNWDLSDLEDKINHILSNYENFVSIAQQGQDNYKRFVSSKESGKLFINHLKSIIEE